MSKPQMLANAIKSCKSSTAKGIFEDEVEGSHMEIQKNPRNSSTVVVCPGKALEFGVGTVWPFNSFWLHKRIKHMFT